MAVSLTKKPLIREYTPEHIRSEEETLPPKLKEYTPEHIAVEPAPQPLTKNYSVEDPACSGSFNVEVINSDLTVLDKEQLCCMMKNTTNEIYVLYNKIEKLTAEAERRAKDDGYWNENYFGNVCYFHEKVGIKITKAHRRYKRRHLMDWLTMETLKQISGIILAISTIVFSINILITFLNRNPYPETSAIMEVTTGTINRKESSYGHFHLWVDTEADYDGKKLIAQKCYCVPEEVYLAVSVGDNFDGSEYKVENLSTSNMDIFRGWINR